MDFKAVVAQTSAVLLTRGVEVEPMAVRDVVALMVRSVAERMNLDAEEAVHIVVPETLAAAIVAAADPEADGAEDVHSVRPVRVDGRTIRVPVRVAGRLVMTAPQAAKYARLNGHGRIADQALAGSGPIVSRRRSRRQLGVRGPVCAGVGELLCDLVEAVGLRARLGRDALRVQVPRPARGGAGRRQVAPVAQPVPSRPQ